MDSIDFNQLFTRYEKRLKYIAYQYTRDPFLAEDIVQEAFLKAFRRLDSVEDTAKVGAWLSAITIRTAIDFLRSEKRRNWLIMDDFFEAPSHGSQTSIEEIVDMRLLKEEINRSLESLTKEYQEVLILHIQYGLKENEIARLLDVKSTTIKTRLYRARKQLKRIVSESVSA